MFATGREYLTGMLDVLVYEGMLLGWRRAPLDEYVIVSHEEEEVTLTTAQAQLWIQGAFGAYLSLVDQGRISPRMPDGA